MNKYIIVNLFFFLSFIRLSSQNIVEGVYLLLRISYLSYKYVGFFAEDDIIIDPQKLNNFKVDTFKETPKVVYNFTVNGGIYALIDAVDLDIYGCCKYGDILKAYGEIFINERGVDNKLEEELKNYKGGIEDYLKKKRGKLIKIKKKTGEYRITLWLVKLEFCICKIFLACPTQAIYKDEVAYIRKIYYVKKPTRKLTRQVKKIILDVVES